MEEFIALGRSTGRGMKRSSQVGGILVGFLLGVIAVGVINLVNAPARGIPIELNPPPSPSPVRVHVNGAIQNPGVYTLPANSIVQDAVNAAGGLTSSAILDNINLASPLEDGQLVYIFSSDESASNPTHAASPIDPNSPKVNINTASASELEMLPGIGPSLAAKIIEFRQANGPFESIDDLLDVSGIGPSKLEEIREHAVVR